MARIVTPRRVRRHGRAVWRVLTPSVITGGRKQARYFPSRELAAAYAREVNGQAVGNTAGPAAEFLALAATDQDRIMRALRAVGGDAVALESAASTWTRRAGVREDLTVEVLVRECLEAKAAAGMRKRSLSSLRCSLLAFLPGRESRRTDSVSPLEIEEWLRSSDWSPATRRGRLTDLRTLFSYAVRKGWLAENPAAGVEKPKDDPKPPGILSVRQAARLLVACRRRDPALLPYVALCLFGGLRPEQEAGRATWESIKAEHVEVAADRAKTRRRRLVWLNPTLASWLKRGGDLPPKNLVRRLRAVRGVARIPWPHDCLRHSFVSYALPVWGPAQVAQWSGHSEAVLFAHYRELVPKAEAERFWRLIAQEGSKR